MESKPTDQLIEMVRLALSTSDGLGLFTTSLHLNAALVTLDGEGVAPPPLDPPPSPLTRQPRRP